MESDQKQTSENCQNLNEDINPEEYYGKKIDVLKNIPVRKFLPPDFLKSIDPNFKSLCRNVRKNLREENYEIFAITGYAGLGKSQLAAIKGCLIDDNYSFGKNINFIPTATEIEKDYLKLPTYSYLHIDEASRSVHKHKWYEKTQQKLSTLYDTERENHYICTSLIMPRFQNFTENFRNFFIKYWINIIARGIAIVYLRDEDKDTKDPWNVDESVKLKKKYWGNKRIFERNVSEIIRMEQRTKNYLFYFRIPEIPKPVWSIYKTLKAGSRTRMREEADSLQVETHRDKLDRIRIQRWKDIVLLRNEGKTTDEIGIILGCSGVTVRRDLKDIVAYNSVKGDKPELKLTVQSLSNSNNNIYKLKEGDNNLEPSSEVYNI